MDAQSFADEFLHCEARIERRKRILKDNLDAAAHVAHRVWGKRQNVLPGKEHLPPGVLFEPYEAMAERRLATARFTHEAKGNAFRNGERHAVYRLHVPHYPLEKPLFHWEMRREVRVSRREEEEEGREERERQRTEDVRGLSSTHRPCGEWVVWVVQIAGDLAPTGGGEEGWGCYRCSRVAASSQRSAKRQPGTTSVAGCTVP